MNHYEERGTGGIELTLKEKILTNNGSEYKNSY